MTKNELLIQEEKDFIEGKDEDEEQSKLKEEELNYSSNVWQRKNVN